MVADLDTGAAGPALLALVFVLAYLLGSIPFGIVLTRLAGGPDLRTIGSGNIGATNVLRTGKRGLAALTLVGDMLKGTLAVVVASRFGETAALVAGLAAFLGHCFPAWLKFRGGKGVATYLGILLGFHFPTAIAVAGVWLLTAFASRYSSLAALIASAAAPVILFLLGHQRLAELFLVLTLIVWVRHRGNIGRLMAGEESRIGAK